VKPIHLNLASRPYEDKRLFAATVAGLALVIAALTFFNVDTYLRYRVRTQTTRAKIEQLDAQTEQERHRGEIAQQQLRSIDVTALSRQTEFINAQLAERAFSWSELLDRLEDVLANDVRITSITPAFRPDGLVHLELLCEAKSPDGLVEMLNRFNGDPHFANAFPTVESNANGVYRIQYGVDYKPADVRAVAQ
jgi:hypothetical protein